MLFQIVLNFKAMLQSSCHCHLAQVLLLSWKCCFLQICLMWANKIKSLFVLIKSTRKYLTYLWGKKSNFAVLCLQGQKPNIHILTTCSLHEAHWSCLFLKAKQGWIQFVLGWGLQRRLEKNSCLKPCRTACKADKGNTEPGSWTVSLFFKATFFVPTWLRIIHYQRTMFEATVFHCQSWSMPL